MTDHYVLHSFIAGHEQFDIKESSLTIRVIYVNINGNALNYIRCFGMTVVLEQQLVPVFVLRQ